MSGQNTVRMDKWLWAVRIFKTRSKAADACAGSKVMVAGEPVKPARTVRIGEIVEVKHPPIIRTFKVLGLLERRVAAKLAVEYVEETTPQEELDKLKRHGATVFEYRDRGLGRPTKKDIRAINKLKKKGFL